MEVGEKLIIYSWDLTHDYDYEQFPDEIDMCLQTALEASYENS